MRLWIDGQCLQTASRLRGIGRYVTELIGAIARQHSEVELLISFNAAMPDEALLAREAVRELIAPDNIHVWHGAARSGEAIEGYTTERRHSEFALAHHVNCLAPDVALSTSPFEGSRDRSVPLLPDRLCAAPIASIFYDAIPYRFSDLYLDTNPNREYYKRRLESHKRYDLNLCISAFSQAELKDILGQVPSQNISAGISSGLIRLHGQTNSSLAFPGNFVLYVGALDGRKNVKTLIDAFQLLDKRWPDNRLSLVLAGDAPPHLLSGLTSRWLELGLTPERLMAFGHVSDEDIVSLYEKAELLVQPSLMEGFGLTALEAMYCGTPVVAARAGALPEVVGQEELLFDPTSADQLADAMILAVKEKKHHRAKLLLKERAGQFTWEKTATTTIESLARLRRADVSTIEASRKRIAKTLRKEGSLETTAPTVFSLAEPWTSREQRLLVDATATSLADHRTGIQRVVTNICRELAAAPPAQKKVGFVFCNDDTGFYELDGRNLRVPQKSERNRAYIASDILLMLDSSWDLYSTHQHQWLACRLRGGNIVTCLYDTVPLFAPAMCDPGMPPIFANWFSAALSNSSAFICISRAVADELLAFLEAIEFPRRMKVGYWQLGADFGGAPPAAASSAPRKQDAASFLMVGTLEPRKGHAVALAAFEELWSEGTQDRLVIVGKLGWGVSYLAERIRSHPEFGHRLFWHEKADDGQLQRLYAECDALIAASFAEGFGLPIVEAGHFGKPVIASDIAVFREVGQGAAEAYFFEPGNSEAMADQVRRFATGKTPQGKENDAAAWPTWAESAQQLRDVVLGDKWYKTYEPRSPKPFAPPSDLGRTKMTKPLPPEERQHRLRLVEGPYPTDDEKALKAIVAVSNLSTDVWSSAGREDGSLAIVLSYHLLNGEGGDLTYDNPRTSIPLALPPGQTIYLPVLVPMEWKARGAEFIDIELVQEGVVWLDNPLRMAL
ncbi:glycosyltransferase family 4 protein [Mesorhizobium sp. B3-1-9]|uniref:glycosyltransferase family 4 protein n=1 Tax=Mesorhizobium sp. B3-1-9 TaxID=2589892 RepID=UPI00112893C4|nr:glycosyltransferase family 1 protein [Mesorhizobium sp. B3-1-9]TPI38562.1 glycosyltransferase family 4 protein [Mesorhizobium sp. B3-1-9]